jgi:DNA-binding MltR family transcriptional regulator
MQQVTPPSMKVVPTCHFPLSSQETVFSFLAVSHQLFLPAPRTLLPSLAL